MPKWYSKRSTAFIVGAANVCDYLGISRSTLDRWRKYYAFPLATLPNGQCATSQSLIVYWLLTRVPMYSSGPAAIRSNLDDIEVTEEDEQVIVEVQGLQTRAPQHTRPRALQPEPW